MVEKLPKATHVGELRIGDVMIPCAVLGDGRRVLSQRGLRAAVGMGEGGGATRMARFLGVLDKYESSNGALSARHGTVVEFRPKGGGRTAYGYDAQIIVDICRAVTRAKRGGLLPAGQYDAIVARCEHLMDALAGVAIVALVDEATGYQADRKREELQAILAAYLAPEMRPWVREFPDEYYENIFRLLKWKWTPDSSARPGFVGILTRQLVYERMPEGVWKALDERAPTVAPGRRAAKLHQYLSADIGVVHLRQHLAAICAFLRASQNWPQFVQMVQSAFPRPGDQLSLFSLEDWMRENVPPGE